MTVFAKHAYLDSGWETDVRITFDANTIRSVDRNSRQQTGDALVDTLLPALSNLHSHSFQRAMAGMTEFRAKGRESFWTWRDLMYRFLDHLTPEQLGDIASMAFMEMQKAGYTAVGEFHYIHNAKNGVIYDDPAELSVQIMRAAKETGIGLTHLPVLYSYGDVDQRPLAGEQLRFKKDVAAFVDLIERCKSAAQGANTDTHVGIAPHSLRATCPKDLSEILSVTQSGPVHIHIAEQMKEVESVSEAFGARPVEWLLDNVDVNQRWCLIHATHMTESETANFAKSGAIAGLCPVTEANLGDGIFNGQSYLKAGGKFGIGTDSNVNISLSEELRTLEYSQRLKHQQRNVLAPEDGSTGEFLYLNAAKGGAQALGRNAGAISEGKLADFVAINSMDPKLCSLRVSQIFDGFVFGANDSVVTDVWSAGRHCVQNGRHVAETEIAARYRKAVTELTASLM